MPPGDEQRARYARQLPLPGVGEEGQRRLAAGRVLVVGVGGLGSAAASYLAAAGVGSLGLIDDDTVEPSNLNRQLLHHTPDVGRAKLASAADKLRALNPEVHLELIGERASASSLPPLLGRFDFVVDGTDSFASKFLINDACVQAGVRYVHAGVIQFQGQLMTVRPGASACLRCLFPAAPEPGVLPTPAEAGVLGTVPGVIGALQAAEALRALLGIGQLATDRLLTYDALDARWHEVRVARDPACPLCGDRTRPDAAPAPR